MDDSTRQYHADQCERVISSHDHAQKMTLQIHGSDKSTKCLDITVDQFQEITKILTK